MAKVIAAEVIFFRHIVRVFSANETGCLNWVWIWRKKKEAFMEEGKDGEKMRKRRKVSRYLKIIILPNLVVVSPSIIYFTLKHIKHLKSCV